MKGTFFGREVLRKCEKSHAKKGMQTGEYLSKDYANNLYQREVL
jgi:hypothetical protein